MFTFAMAHDLRTPLHVVDVKFSPFHVHHQMQSDVLNHGLKAGHSTSSADVVRASLRHFFFCFFIIFVGAGSSSSDCDDESTSSFLLSLEGGTSSNIVAIVSARSSTLWWEVPCDNDV